MSGRSAAQLVDIRLVEDKRIEDSYFQDYARVHERLERQLEKESRPLTEEAALAAADGLVAWLAGQAARSVPLERLSQFLRCGLGHVCAELAALPGLNLDQIASRAYDEMRRRGWDQAAYDPDVAAAAAKRVAAQTPIQRPDQKRAPPATKSKTPPAGAPAGVKSKVGSSKPKVAEDKASKAAPAKKEAPMTSEKKSAPAKKAAASKTTAEKKTAASATKAAARKPATKVAAKKAASAKTARKPASRAAAAKKPAVRAAAKKTVVKTGAKKSAVKAAAKKPATKIAAKAAARKPVTKAAARKPAVKATAKKSVVKAAAKKPAAPRKPAAPKPMEVRPVEDKKPDPTL